MIHFFFFLSSVSLALGRLEILSPPSLKDWWDTHFQEKNLSISYYGDIPWGTEIKGRISTVSPLNACSRLALDDETNSSAEIIVVVRGGCQMASKVRNLKPLGAKLLLVIDSKNEETDSSVLIDPRGETEIIHIPSALISKKAGDKLLEALDDSDTDTEPVTGVLDLKIEQSRLVKYHLWLSSSNEQTIPFLKEWKEYADLLSSSTTSEIHYGFIYSNDSSPINKDPDEDNCICGGRYCLPDSMQSYFLSGSEAILENIRQNCVRSVYGVDSWWAYIKRFNMSCLAKKKMRDCSAYTLSEIDVEPASIDACVDLYFGDTSPKECMKSARLEKEAKILVKDDAFIFPSFIINGEAYRGNLYPDQVFEFICHSFITMPTECQDYFNPPAPAPSSEPQPAPTSTPGQNTPDQTTTPLPSPDTKPGEKPQPEPTTNLPEPLESRPPKPTPSETEPPGTPPPQNIPTQTATPPTEPSETKPKENPSTDPTSPDTSTSNSTSTEAQPKPAPSTSSTEPSGTKPEEKPTTSISTENEPPASSNSTTVPSDYPETKPSNSSEDMSSKSPSEVPSEKKPSEDKSPVKGREGSASEIMVSQSKPEGPNDSGYYLIIVAVIISVAAAAAGAYYFKRNKKIAIKQEDEEEEEEEEEEKVEKKKQQQIKSPKEEYIVLDDTKTERDEEKGGKEEVNDSNQEL